LHRDINPENLIWNNERLVGLVDWENVGSYREPFVKDIAVTFQHSFRNRGHHLDLNRAKHFLLEYSKTRPLSYSEIMLIPDLMVSGFIEDFVYAYWMIRNDPDRARVHRLKLYSRAAQWNSKNRHTMIQALSESC
jgi:Ser/Thr protein kinase RdoA (MazF antagonist)